MTTQVQMQNVRNAMPRKRSNETQSRVNQQISVLTKAMEKIVSLRQMTSSTKKQ